MDKRKARTDFEVWVPNENGIELCPLIEAIAKFPDEDRCLIMAARSAWMIAQTNGSKKADLEEAIRLFTELEKATPNEPDYWGESLYILYNNTQQTAQAAKYKKYYKSK